MKSICQFKDQYDPIRTYIASDAPKSRHLAAIVSYGEAEWNYYVEMLKDKYFQSTREDFKKLKKLAESI